MKYLFGHQTQPFLPTYYEKGIDHSNIFWKIFVPYTENTNLRKSYKASKCCGLLDETQYNLLFYNFINVYLVRDSLLSSV